MDNKPISGAQVSLLVALFLSAGIRSTQDQLEWLEFEAEIKVNKLEEVPTGSKFQAAVNILKKLTA